MSETNTVRLYRIENPTVAARPDGIVSHQDLIGQWFTPNIGTATNYLRKSTQTFGRDAHAIEGVRLIATDVPHGDLEGLHVSGHPIASGMDVEDDNYIISPDAEYPRAVIELDELLDDLKGDLGKFPILIEAKKRVADLVQELGEITVNHA